MSKVIDYNDVWYHEVAPRSYYLEDELERTIIQNLEIIFPEYNAFLFKIPLQDKVRLQNNIADLAMVKKDYSEWYVIEVELGKHAKSHVVDQIKSFYNCSYTDDHAIYINKQRPDLDLNSLKKMIAGNPPLFMVIVNEPKPDWVKDLSSLNCKACVFQIYHDYKGNSIYRLNGEHPYIKIDFCHCRYQKALPYAVEILDNVQMLDANGITDGVNLEIEFIGKVYTWTREDAANRVFLKCKSPRPPLDPLRATYRLNYNQTLIKKSNYSNKLFKLLQKIKLLKPDTTFLITFSFTKD